MLETQSRVIWKSAERLLFALAFAGTACWCIASISYPMGFDQGMMASVGDVILRGGLPYRDAFDMKGPLPYYLFALVQAFVGRVMWGIRLLDLGLLLSAAVCFRSLLRRLEVSETISRWLALGLVLAAASRTWFHVSQPDGWAADLTVIAVFLSMARPASKLCRIASGVLIGAAALIKPFYILFLAVPVTIAITGGLGTLIAPILLTGAGAALPVLAALGWFSWNGALKELVAVHYTFNVKAYSGIDSFSFGNTVESIASYLWNGAPRDPAGPFGVLLVPIVAGIVLAWRSRRTTGVGPLLWLAIALTCVALQGKYLVYHWLVAFPPLLALAGFALTKIANEKSTRILAAAAIGVFITGVAVRPVWDSLRFAKYAVGLDSREDYFNRFQRLDFRPFSAMNAASYIKTHSRPEEGVAVFGEDALVQFLSERPSPTRFVFSLPLNVPNVEYRDSYRSEFMSALRRTPARYIVLGTHQDEATTESGFPEFWQLLSEHYKRDKTFGRLELYRLDDDPHGQELGKLK